MTNTRLQEVSSGVVDGSAAELVGASVTGSVGGAEASVLWEGALVSGMGFSRRKSLGPKYTAQATIRAKAISAAAKGMRENCCFF